MSIRIVIADDHAVVREGIRKIVETRLQWNVCGEAETGDAAVRLAAELNPDVVIMDVSMPRMSGIEATRKIAERRSDIRVLIFTMHESANLVAAARSAGARGLVTKSSGVTNLIRGLEHVVNNGKFYEGLTG